MAKTGMPTVKAAILPRAAHYLMRNEDKGIPVLAMVNPFGIMYQRRRTAGRGSRGAGRLPRVRGPVGERGAERSQHRIPDPNKRGVGRGARQLPCVARAGRGRPDPVG